MHAVDALRACPLLHGFTDTGLTILAGVCAERSYPAGTPLFVENMVSDSLLVIAQGRVALSTKSERGDLSLGELGPGDWLGELALVQNGQRACSATATGPVVAFELRALDFQKLMASKPQACLKLLMAIGSHLGQKVLANQDALKSLAAKGP